MTGPRWREIETVFSEALAVPVAERDTWLSERCGTDAELLREVRTLLDNDDPNRETIAVAVQQAFASLPAGRMPRRAGPYELMEELGRGGMGTVYKARRADQAYEAVVAVKLVRPGMDTDFVLGRFRQERQTLAMLNHPNIARLLDGGTTEDGVPFIVMEYIDGQRITDYCKPLPLEQKLRLMRDVCLATDHAHRNFVVHRDIKPGNILVDRAGTPKLLDFGICKLLHANPLDTEVTMTQGLGAMTPDYASPEQVLGEAISPRSDVYSLGVVLYELLTGVRPHKFAKITLLSIEEAICNTPVTAPSAVTNGRLSRALRGDLDNIVMKALEKDTLRRYESAAALAEDIRRYLEQEPVAARPAGRLYRAGKFIRRHRVLTGAVAAVLLASTVGTLVSLRQTQRAEARERDLRAMARVFLYDVHDSVRDLPGATKARQTIVHTAVDYLNKLAGSNPSEPELVRELAAGYQRIADLQGSDARGSNLGQSRAALATYAKAIGYWDRLLAATPGDRKAAVERVNALRRSADLLAQLDGAKASLDWYDRSEAAARALLKVSPGDLTLQALVADILTVSGRKSREAGDSPGSLRKSEEALALAKSLSDAMPGDREKRTAVSSAESAVGMAKARLGDLPGALALYESSVAHGEAMVAAEPQNVSVKRNLMIGYSHLGDVLGYPELPNLGETAKADAVYAKMVTLAREMQAADPKDARASMDAAIALMRWAAVAPTLPEREKRLRESLELVKARLAAAPSNLTLVRYEGAIEYQLGVTAQALGRPAEALQHWRRAVEVVSPSVLKGNESQVKTFVVSVKELMAREPLAELRASGRARLEQVRTVAERVAAKAEGVDDLTARAMAPRAYAAWAIYHGRLGDAVESAAWRQKALDVWKQLAARPGFLGNYREEMREMERWRP